MIRRAASSLRLPSVNAEDIIGLVCLAGLWYGLHLVSDALAWTVVSAIGLVLAAVVAVGRSRTQPTLPPQMTENQFAALMGSRAGNR